MALQFLSKSLARWDEAQADALVLTFFADERPLRGASGLADWRLCGRISRLIKAGKLSGRRGEVLLMPPGERLGFDRLLVFGLGTKRNFTEDVFRQHVRWILDVTRRMGSTSYAFQPPGRAAGLIAARRALEIWLEEMAKESHGGEIAIIDSPGAHKEMAELLRPGRRSSSARERPADAE